MRVMVVDGMGGGIGTQLVAQLAGQSIPGLEVLAVGTNAWATQSMLKAGATRGASGENSIRVTARQVDIIAGPIGIVIPNALMGEITPGIAETIAGATARKILIPVNQGHFEIVGLENRPLVGLIREVVARIVEAAAEPRR
jgi:hypothetical protein